MGFTFTKGMHSMAAAWTEVAQLGKSGARYPHLLVDPHGWCLRLGPKRSEDDKFYSNLPSLLGGLIEHFARRHLAGINAPLDLLGFSQEVTAALRSGQRLCQAAVEKGGLETHQRLLKGMNGFPTLPIPSLVARQASSAAGTLSSPGLRKKAI
jgi:hypothetical protein